LIFPLRDENPSGTFPLVTVGIIAANILIFLYEMSLGEGVREFVGTYGVVPARLFGPGDSGGAPGAAPAGGAGAYLPFLTAMFLHGGVGHLVGNMWLLWLAGDNIEDRIGHGAFILFYLIAGVAASAAHVILSGPSTLPMIGASGAIAGVLGAYVICFPRARVVMLVWLFFIFVWFVRVPAVILIGLWFAVQMLSALVESAHPGRLSSGIAWWAHIGGFLAGAVLIVLWPKCKRTRQEKYKATPDRWRADRG
jgi:membrane associated rhomboid family serine protease